MVRRVVHRCAAALAGAVVVLGVIATPASAHTIGGPRPTNYRSRVVAIEPNVPGISARIVDLGAKIELTNRGSTDVTVLGYEGEPYLRVGPDGVFENLHSQATYINRSRLGGSVPLGVDTAPTAQPEWKKIGSGHAARWHDHRIHWMSPQPPPQVAAAPGTFQHLSQQNIVLVRNGERVAIAVALDWVPGPSGLPWLPAAIALFVVGAIVAMMPRWRLLALLLGVIVVCDIAHAVGFEIPRPGGNTAKTLQFLSGNFVSIAVWVATVPTIVALLRRRVEALYGVVFVALLAALIGGATDLSALWNSQLPDAGPAWLSRVEVVVALGLGGGLAVGALVRMLRSRAVSGSGGGGRWLSLLVAGLSEAELARIVPELDADEVLEVALRELAIRSAPVAAQFVSGSLVFVVTEPPEATVWSIALRDGALTSVRGRAEPMAAEMRAPFAVMLQLLAGSVLVDDAIDRGRVAVEGDASFVARLAAYIPESGVVTTAEGPASSS
ncbi:MAG TPA: SCP2 sterol-binding domain-containing protein [Acidimicrobiia bacterium]|nr:SCP2 sterol-binding domain-containing protein [Acidimicrobiia bacterium]